MELTKLLALGLLPTAAIACGGGQKTKPRPYPAPEVTAVLGELRQRQSDLTSFVAESRMEYWQGKERIKPTVLVMGEQGAKVRFNALNPTGGDVAADLACDGTSFSYVDFNNNCQLSGPCNRDSIAQLLRVSLEPDDFLLLAVGSVPLLPASTGVLRWDGKSGNEILSLESNGFRQEVVLDGRDARWDVLQAKMWDPQGNVEWTLENKDFKTATTEDGKPVRLPDRTRFSQPADKAEVTIRWIERFVNESLDPEKFDLQLPGVAPCGKQ